jgi:hypothetical protein
VSINNFTMKKKDNKLKFIYRFCKGISISLFLLLLCVPYTFCNPLDQITQKAQLFKSVDENLQPVDMQDLINGRPLVLAVSSAT